MPTEDELLGIINGQRKYYKEGILQLAKLLRDARLFDYADAAISISNNFGILNELESKRTREEIANRRSEDLTENIVKELSDGELSAGELRKKLVVTKSEEHSYRKAIDTLLIQRRIDRTGATKNTKYRLVGNG